jgi:hypothetical protein
MSRLKQIGITLALAAIPCVAAAQESCAIRAARLLSTGETAQLAALFKSPVHVAADLKALSTRAGALSALVQVQQPRFTQHQRLSAGRANGAYAGSWVNAESALLGPVQLHLAQPPSGACELLALHLDFSREPPAAGGQR